MDAELLAGVGLEREYADRPSSAGRLPWRAQWRCRGSHRSSPVPGALLRGDDGSPAARARAHARTARSERASRCTHRQPSRRAPEKSRQTCESHYAGGRVRPRESQDQRNVGHEAVADAEHGGPSAAPPDVAVVVFLGRQLGEALRLAPSPQYRGQPPRETRATRAALGRTPRGHKGAVSRWSHDSRLEQVSARCATGAAIGASTRCETSFEARERGREWQNLRDWTRPSKADTRLHSPQAYGPTDVWSPRRGRSSKSPRRARRPGPVPVSRSRI